MMLQMTQLITLHLPCHLPGNMMLLCWNYLMNVVNLSCYSEQGHKKTFDLISIAMTLGYPYKITGWFDCKMTSKMPRYGMILKGMELYLLRIEFTLPY